MNKLKLALSTILAGLLFSLFGVPALAADDLVANFETDPLFNAADGLYMPGDAVTKQVEVYHTGADDQQIKVEVDAHTDLDDLGSVFDFEVKDTGGTYYFIGSLKGFLDFGVLPLAVQSQNEHKTYLFTATLPASTGNDWQGKTLQFDLSIFVSADEPPGGPGDDGVHLVCAPTSQCVIAAGEGADDAGCGYAGESCSYIIGTGDFSTTADTTPTPPPSPGPTIAGAAVSAPGGGAVEPGEEEKEEESVKGVAVEEGAVAGEEASAECCCLWWVFILLQAVVCVAYLVKNKGRKVTYARLAIVWTIFGITSFILWVMFCSKLQGLLGCIWPSGILPAICKWYWYLLIDLLALLLLAIPYFLIRSGLGKQEEDDSKPPKPKLIQSFLKSNQT